MLSCGWRGVLCGFFAAWLSGERSNAAAPPAPAPERAYARLEFPRLINAQVAFSSDAGLVAAHDGVAAEVYDLRTGKVLLRVAGVNARPVAFALDEGAVALSDGAGGPLSAVGLRTQQRLAGVPPLGRWGSAGYGDQLSADAGTRAVVRGAAYVFEGVAGGPAATLAPPQGSRHSWGLFASGGSFLVVTVPRPERDSCAVQLWEDVARKGRRLRGALPRIQGSTFRPTSASADGRCFAGGAEFLDPGVKRFVSRVQVWEVCGGKAFEAKAEAHAVALSDDGRLLAIGRKDRSVDVWDLATGTSAHALVGLLRDEASKMAFLSCGQRFAAWNAREVAVWDLALTRRALPAVEPLKDAELDGAWADLLGDSQKAQRTMWRMAATPTLAVPMIAARQKPSPVVLTAEGFERIVREMDDALFAVREAASERLASLKERAVPFLREAEGRKDLPRESARRLALVREKLDDPLAGLSGERLRAWRAVAVLERVGDANARLVLRKLSGGAPEDMLTREAKGALRRLADADRRARDARR